MCSSTLPHWSWTTEEESKFGCMQSATLDLKTKMKDLTQEAIISRCMQKTRWWVYPSNKRSGGEEWHETNY